MELTKARKDTLHLLKEDLVLLVTDIRAEKLADEIDAFYTAHYEAEIARLKKDIEQYKKELAQCWETECREVARADKAEAKIAGLKRRVLELFESSLLIHVPEAGRGKQYCVDQDDADALARQLREGK